MVDEMGVRGVIDGVIEHIRAAAALVTPGDGEFHLRTLLKIRDWAVAQQPVQVGDRVRLDAEVDFDAAHGWRPWRELLRPGALGTVEEISFNGVHDYWGATVRFDGGDGLFVMHVKWLSKIAGTKTPSDPLRASTAHGEGSGGVL